MPLVSVILPTRDRQALTTEAIRSVVNQTLTDWELIIVDDGEGFVNDLSDDPRITQKRSSVCGLGAAVARNTGMIYSSESKYFAFLDSDDLWEPDYLQTQTERMEENPTAIISTTSYVSQGVTQRKYPRYPENLLASMYLDNWIHTLSTVVTRRDRTPMFSNEYKVVHDRDFYLKLFRRSNLCPTTHKTRPLVTKRWRSDSLVGQNDCGTWLSEGLALIDAWAEHEPKLARFQEQARNLFEAKVQSASHFFRKLNQQASPDRTNG